MWTFREAELPLLVSLTRIGIFIAKFAKNGNSFLSIHTWIDIHLLTFIGGSLMLDKIENCPECNAKMTSGWIGEKGSLHWYNNPKPIRTIFGFGDPIFAINPWKQRSMLGKQGARRCFNCGLIVFKADLAVKKSFFLKPFAPVLLIFAVLILATVIAGFAIINLLPTRLPVPQAAKVMSNITPITGFRYFSGYYDAAGNHPALYAHGSDDKEAITIVGPGQEQEIPMKESDRAFQVYRDLLIKRGYAPK